MFATDTKLLTDSLNLCRILEITFFAQFSSVCLSTECTNSPQQRAGVRVNWSQRVIDSRRDHRLCVIVIAPRAVIAAINHWVYYSPLQVECSSPRSTTPLSTANTYILPPLALTVISIEVALSVPIYFFVCIFTEVKVRLLIQAIRKNWFIPNKCIIFIRQAVARSFVTAGVSRNLFF